MRLEDPYNVTAIGNDCYNAKVVSRALNAKRLRKTGAIAHRLFAPRIACSLASHQQTARLPVWAGL